MKIINLTQHSVSDDQAKDGVIRHTIHHREICELLTFHEIPTQLEIAERASKIADLALSVLQNLRDRKNKPGLKGYAMIGGAPFLMPALEQELRIRDIQPLYAFSERCSIEEVSSSGETVKKSVFKHLGFVNTSASN